MAKIMQPAHVEAIVIHCAATPPTMDIGREEIRHWHIQRGFFDIGYHFVIRRNGQVEKGREITEFGAHARGWNQRSIGICLVGGINASGRAENNFTPEQFDALFALVDTLTGYEGYGHCTVVGHRDLPGVTKECPSFDARDWWFDAKAAQMGDY